MIENIVNTKLETSFKLSSIIKKIHFRCLKGYKLTKKD